MSYRRRPVKAPRLTGRMLDAVVRLAEGVPTGALFRAKMLADIGVLEFRESAALEDPTVLPLHPAAHDSEGESADPEALAAQQSADGPRGHRPVSAGDLAKAYREGRSSPLTVAERLIEAVKMSERHEPALRFFISFDEEDLLLQAKEATRRFREGKPLGLLDGVPVAVKDEIDQKGHPTTVGTSFMGAGAVSSDATVVGRLRSAGAVLVGKTNMHEIGLGVSGLNLHHGPARNPYDPGCITGGSSSGSAAIVAAGLCPVAVGADGGGSIRIPAGLCGVVGLKTTFGRISGAGSAPLCWSVGQVGPIAGNVRDAALAYALMAGPDPKDPKTLGQPEIVLPDLDDLDLSSYRLGVYRPWLEDADAEVVAAMDSAIEGLCAAGATVEEIEIPDLHLFRIAHMITIVSEMAASQMRTKDRSRYGPDVRLNLALAAGLTASDYVHAQRLRTRAMRVLSAVLGKVDGILTPATGCTAVPIRDDALVAGESDLVTLDRIMRFASLANLTGHPAISFPAGYDCRGLPIGCQVMGPAWREDLLLRVAAVAETFTRRVRPRWYASPLSASSSQKAVAES